MRAATMTRTLPRPRLLRWPVLCCAVISLAAHAVLLDAIEVTTRPGSQGGKAAWHQVDPGQRMRPVPAVHIRTVAMASARAAVARHAPARPAALAAPTATPAHEPAQQAAPHETMPLSGGMDAGIGPDAMAAMQAAAPTTVEPTDATAPAPWPSNEAPQEVVTEAVSRASIDDAIDQGLDGYVPRPQLSVVPSPKAPVLLAAPDGDTGVARHVGVLSLYIDEGGRVHHITPDEPRLPPDYERAARDAFMAAVFTPGELAGRVVKSRIRIEVVFDNTPL